LITIDFETFYDTDYSLSRMTTEEYIRSPLFEVIGVGIKVDNNPAYWVTGSDVRGELERLNLHNEKVLAHNAAFDGAILAWRYGIVPKFFFDTMLISRPKHQTNVGGSLAKLVEYYGLGVKGAEVINAKGKRLEHFTEQQLEQYGCYCRNDVEITYELFNTIQDQATPQELFIMDMMLRMFICPVIELDQPLLRTYLDTVQGKKSMLLERVGQVKAPELMSNQQFAQLLEKLGVAPPMKVSLRTGKPTLALSKSDEAFQALQEHEDPRVQTLVAARLGIKSTIEETRTQRFIEIAQRGKLPIMLNYWGAHTGRASGGEKLNLQNLPRGGTLRAALKAPNGHSLIAVDSAQIEARVVAWLAGQTDLVDDFANGEDIYSKFASKVYKYEVTKATHKTERHVGKTSILGLGFGMGTDKFQNTLKVGTPSVVMTEKEARAVVDLYRTSYSKIKDLWKQADAALTAMVDGHEFAFGVGIKLKCKGTEVELPNGTFIRYPQLQKDDSGFSYKNRYGQTYIYGGKFVENIVQALARIIVFYQMAKIEQAFRKHSTTDGLTRRVVLTVHDEVVAVVPDGEVEHWHDVMIDVMSSPPKWATGLPIACEAAVGHNYAECK